MTDLQKLKAEILADGTIEDHEVEVIRRELYADGRIDRGKVEFLITLRNEAQSACPAFEQLFFRAVKEKVLTDGFIDAEEAAWLWQILFADGQIDEHKRTFLRELDAEAQSVCREFEQLYDECMKA